MTSIAIIIFSPHKTNFETLTEKINKKYCIKNNYDFFTFNNCPVFMQNKNYNWCSYYYILELLQKQEKKYDYVLYIDSNSFFCDHNKRIEQWILSDKNIYIGLDPTVKYILRKNNPTKVKTNVTIFKNSDWTIQFLNFILTDSKHKQYWKIKNGCETAFRRCLFFNNCNIKDNICFIKNFNFNNYNDNLKNYIKNGGWVLSLTNIEDENQKQTIAKQFIKINK